MMNDVVSFQDTRPYRRPLGFSSLFVVHVSRPESILASKKLTQNHGSYRKMAVLQDFTVW